MTNQINTLSRFFANAVKEFDRMVDRSFRYKHPWMPDEIAAGKVLVTALVYSPRFEVCALDCLATRRIELVQECVAAAYLATPDIHGKLPAPYAYASDDTYPALNELDWWAGALEKAERFINRRKERQTAAKSKHRRKSQTTAPQVVPVITDEMIAEALAPSDSPELVDALS